MYTLLLYVPVYVIRTVYNVLYVSLSTIPWACTLCGGMYDVTLDVTPLCHYFLSEFSNKCTVIVVSRPVMTVCTLYLSSTDN